MVHSLCHWFYVKLLGADGAVILISRLMNMSFMACCLKAKIPDSISSCWSCSVISFLLLLGLMCTFN